VTLWAKPGRSDASGGLSVARPKVVAYRR